MKIILTLHCENRNRYFYACHNENICTCGHKHRCRPFDFSVCFKAIAKHKTLTTTIH